MTSMDEDKKEDLRLRRALASLEGRIRDNERIWAGFRDLEIRMIGARSFGGVIDVLSDGIRATFPAVGHVTVAYLDPQYEVMRLLREEGAAVFDPAIFLPVSAPVLDDLYPHAPVPRLGACDAETQGLLFPGGAQAFASVALVPLLMHGQLIGSLNQGSMRSGHFADDQNTDLLQHLGAVAALCLDNALSHQRLRQDGLTDPLTQVPNRRFFGRRLEEEAERWARERNPLSCLVIDLDHFKQVNDRYGHWTGDRALKQVAQVLAAVSRASDVMARFGGEEFVLLLPDTSPARAVEIAERLRRRVADLAIEDPEADPLRITVSIGVACLERTGVDPNVKPADWLLREADAALYRAKKAGRNRVVAAGPERLDE